jgi:hypothetical protein
MELYNCPAIDRREIARISNELSYVFTSLLYEIAAGHYWPLWYNLYNAYWRLSKPAVKKGRRLI